MARTRKNHNQDPSDTPPTRRAAFICSRMEELSSSRRAVVQALLGAGVYPMLYEAEALPVIYAPSHRIETDRRAINKLLARSDLLVMIVAESLGVELPSFCGLTASEYEFYRFLRQWYLRDIEGLPWLATLSQVESEFAPAHSEVGVTSAVAEIRRTVDTELRILACKTMTKELQLDPSSCTRDGVLRIAKQIDRAVRIEDMTYGKVFFDRVLICRKKLRGDRPASQHTASFCHSKPVIIYRSAQVNSNARGQLPDSREYVDLPPVGNLYEGVKTWSKERWLVPSREDTAGLEGVTCGPLTHLRIGSTPQGGFLKRIASILMTCGFNIDGLTIRISRPDEGDHRERFVLISMHTMDFAGRPSGMRMEDVLARLRRDVSDDVSTIDADEHKRLLDLDKPRSKTKDVFKYQICASNVPGMLVRVLASIERLGGQVVRIKRSKKWRRHSDPSGAIVRNTRNIDVAFPGTSSSDAAESARQLLHVLAARVGVLWVKPRRPW